MFIWVRNKFYTSPTIHSMSNPLYLLAACRKNPLFDSLSPGIQEALVRIASFRSYPAEEYIFYASEISNQEFFIVDEGRLLLSLGSGREKDYQPGDLFGEISVLSQRPRMGSIQALTETRLIVFEGEKLQNPALFSPDERLAILQGLTSYVIDYLDEEEYQNSTAQVLKRGEGVSAEFKLSLSKDIKKTVIETICAFFNTRGGTILLGVHDTRGAVGLSVPSKKIDQYKCSIIQMIKERVGPEFGTYLHFLQDKIDGKLLLRINVKATPFPAIFETPEREQLFYVRMGPTTHETSDIKEVLKHYDQRFARRS